MTLMIGGSTDVISLCETKDHALRPKLLCYLLLCLLDSKMDSVEERIALAELFTHFLRGIKEFDDYIKRTSQYFEVPPNITDLKHSLLLWQEHVEINKEISQKKELLAELVNEGEDLIKRAHPESANVQECMDSKEDDLKNLKRACEEQMHQLLFSIISCLKKKNSYRKLESESGNSESRVGNDQIPIPVKDIEASELTIKLRQIFEKSWGNYQPSALLEIEKLLLKPFRLHTAVLCCAYEEVERLCKTKEEFEQRDFLGRTALHVAIFCTVTHKETEVVTNIFHLLLNGGFDPWEEDDLMGWNCFEYAARIKAYPALNSLLSEIGEERSNIKVDFEELAPTSLAGDYVNILKCCNADTINKNAREFILEMCEKGSANALNYVLETFDVYDHLNQVDQYQNTLLHKACAKQRFTVLELLLRYGLSVDAANLIGRTALHVASDVRALKCIEVLLEHGSDVLAKDKEGQTPLYLGRHHTGVLDLLTGSSSNTSYNQLHLSAYSGNVEYVGNLIQIGHDVNSLGAKNENLLHIAVEMSNDGMLQLFAEKVADLNVHNNSGLTPLHLALQKGHVKCAEILINKGADIECEDKMQNKPLHLAARYGHDSALKMLLTKGAKVYPTNMNDQSALHLACHYSNFNCVETLLQNGAYVNSIDKWGNYPLYLAAKNGDADVLNLLCEKGADVDAENLRKQTALHRASEQGNAAWVNGLLKRQANVNSRDENSNTPLILAAKHGHHDVLKLLIRKKASLHVANEKYETAMRLACENGSLESVKELESNGVTRDSLDVPFIFYAAASKGHKQVITYLISKGWDINKVSDSDENASALNLAAAESHAKCAQILIENGADVNAETANGLKPIHVAACSGTCHILKVLLDHGININCTEKLKRTALHLVAMKPHSSQTIKFLIENGANINLQDVEGHTPLHLAFFKENKEAINVLQQHGARLDIRNKVGLRANQMPVHRNMFFSEEDIAHRIFLNLLFRSSPFFFDLH